MEGDGETEGIEDEADEAISADKIETVEELGRMTAETGW
jgi:hypothetical protein